MSDTLKERIEREVALRLTNALPDWMDEEIADGRADATDKSGASVFRWDAREDGGKPFTIQVTAGDERVDGQITDSGTNAYEMSLPLTVEMLVIKKARSLDLESSSKTHNRWLGRLLTVLFADSDLTEDTSGAQLALDTLLVGTANPPAADDQEVFYSIVDMEVHYQMYRNNPYAGPFTAAN